MPYCPECKYEYVQGIKQCPDCNVDLIEKLPEESQTKQDSFINAELVCVSSYPYDVWAQEARIELQANGIESVIMNEIMSQIDIFVASADGGVRLMVRKEDVEKAKAILEH